MSKSGRLLTRSQREADYICKMAPMYDQRTGQFLFNSLRHEIADKVRSTKMDMFYKDMSLFEVTEWLENHIVYAEDGRMICLFEGNKILWEEG